MSTISYLGIPGSFSYIAAMSYFSGNHEFIGVKNFEGIFKNIQSGKTTHGVVPVENTLAGSIYENYDHLFEYPVYAVGEQKVKIEHHLLVNQDAGVMNDLKRIKKVYSHPKALEQCERFFDNHPWMEEIAYSDTAAAAKMVAEKGSAMIAAIANSMAAKLYNLHVLKSNIEDDANNFTRFLVLGTNHKKINGADKCSLIITLPHTPGSLYAALAKLSEHGINLTKIESRPILGKPFEYVFYIDIEFAGKTQDEMKQIIKGDFKKQTKTLKIFGFYKSAQA